MGSTAQTFTLYRRHRNNLPFKMRFIIALALFTVVIARPDGHGWGQQQQHQQPTNVEYGPWVAQDNYQRDSKGIISHVATYIPQISTLRNLGSFWTWDKQAVYNGIFKNDNIMIHVAQNFFNFIFTTLAWFFISQIYSSGIVGEVRLGKSITFSEAADEVLEASRILRKSTKIKNLIQFRYTTNKF